MAVYFYSILYIVAVSYWLIVFLLKFLTEKSDSNHLKSAPNMNKFQYELFKKYYKQ